MVLTSFSFSLFRSRNRSCVCVYAAVIDGIVYVTDPNHWPRTIKIFEMVFGLKPDKTTQRSKKRAIVNYNQKTYQKCSVVSWPPNRLFHQNLHDSFVPHHKVQQFAIFFLNSQFRKQTKIKASKKTITKQKKWI